MRPPPKVRTSHRLQLQKLSQTQIFHLEPGAKICSNWPSIYNLARGGGMAENSTLRQKWERKLDFLLFFQIFGKFGG